MALILEEFVYPLYRNLKVRFIHFNLIAFRAAVVKVLNEVVLGEQSVYFRLHQQIRQNCYDVIGVDLLPSSK